jgi:hypothetical protein
MAISIKSRKAKARRLQNWAAKKISGLLGIPCGKDKDIQGREMGQSGADVRLMGVARELFKYSVECKFCESWAIPAWIKQAKSNQDEETDWLLFIKKNRHEEIVIMDAEAFFKLCKKALEKEK